MRLKVACVAAERESSAQELRASRWKRKRLSAQLSVCVADALRAYQLLLSLYRNQFLRA